MCLSERFSVNALFDNVVSKAAILYRISSFNFWNPPSQ